VRLQLSFSNGELNLYACAIRIIEEDVDEVYDWSGDVMNDAWGRKEGNAKLKKLPKIIGV
jgi:endonuclease-8